jgi:hypothetical protein
LDLGNEHPPATICSCAIVLTFEIIDAFAEQHVPCHGQAQVQSNVANLAFIFSPGTVGVRAAASIIVCDPSALPCHLQQFCGRFLRWGQIGQIVDFTSRHVVIQPHTGVVPVTVLFAKPCARTHLLVWQNLACPNQESDFAALTFMRRVRWHPHL